MEVIQTIDGYGPTGLTLTYSPNKTPPDPFVLERGQNKEIETNLAYAGLNSDHVEKLMGEQTTPKSGYTKGGFPNPTSR